MTKKIYIAGPMTGIKEENLPEFEKAKALFEAKGFEVIIPHDIAKKNPGCDYGALLAHDIFIIGTEVDVVAMLPYWYNSRGAVAEYTFARTCRKVIVDATNGYPIAKSYSDHMVIDGSLDQLINECKIHKYGYKDNQDLSAETNCAAGNGSSQRTFAKE